MPFTHSTDEKKRMLVIEGSGVGGLGELLDALRSAIDSASQGTIPPDYAALVNIDALQELSPSHTDLISQFINRLTRLLRGPIAIVTSTPDKMVPAIMISMDSHDSTGMAQYFKSEAEAHDWILTRRA